MNILELKVVDIRRAAKDAATVSLERADGQPLDYQAGQFLTFLFSFEGHALRRSYSLSSAPGIDPVPAITVKRVINGEISRRLLDHLKTGDDLLSLPPAGRFVLPDEEAQLCFIAAGSGMAPVFSLVKEALAKRPGQQVILLSQHHDEDSILFKVQLDELLRQYKYNGRFRWISLLSSPEGDGSEGAATRLNNWLLEELLGGCLPGNDPGPPGEKTLFGAKTMPGKKTMPGEKTLFYLCGPPAFMRMAQFTLRLMGQPEARIKKENFTVEYVPPPPLLTDTRTKTVTIQTGNNLYRFETAWPASILQAALDHHIPLPYSCRGGRCSSCVAKCLSGKVKMSINEVLTETDLQNGLVLTCVGYAETDLELALL